MFFNDRLAYAQLVNTIADRFDGLSDSAIFRVGQGGGLHGYGPGVVRAGNGFVFRQLRADEAPQIGDSFRWNALDENLFGMIRRVGFGDFGVVDFGRAHSSLQYLNGVV